MRMTVHTPGLVERSKTVAAVAEEHADYGDKEWHLAEPVVEALHREGLFRYVGAAIDARRRRTGYCLVVASS